MPRPLLKVIHLLIGAAAVGLATCQSPDQSASAPRASPALPAPAAVPVSRVVEQPLGKTGFYLSLPATYALRSTDAADFLVYYFAPVNTTVRTSFTGGLYFGGHPRGPSPAAASCQLRHLPTILLGRPATWQINRCATGYTLSAVFDSHSGEQWNNKINAFGAARSAAELRQLLAIFATLRQSPAPTK